MSKPVKLSPETEKEYLLNSIKYYFSEKTSFDGHKKSFDVIKADFEKDMDMLFEKHCNEDNELKVKTSDTFAGMSGIKVKKVQPTSTEVNAKAFMENVDDEELIEELVDVNYSISDVIGLLTYLKEIGVRYSSIKKFVRKEYSITKSALDNAYELGKIDLDTVSKCVSIKNKKPYYTLTPIKNNNTRKPIL